MLYFKHLLRGLPITLYLIGFMVFFMTILFFTEFIGAMSTGEYIGLLGFFLVFLFTIISPLVGMILKKMDIEAKVE